MAPPKKKRKISSAEKKKQASERGTKAAEKQGKGPGSRKSFSLPAKWREQKYKCGNETRVKFSSPGKTEYETQKAVKETLETRGMKDCINEHFSSSLSSGTNTDESDFRPISTDDEQMDESPTQPITKGEDMERRLFVCESTQLMDLVQQINDSSKCGTADCNGILVLVKVEPTGLGGTLNATFTCNSCKQRTVNFQGSALVEGSKRTVVGLALAVAFFVSGHGFAKFEKTLRQFLGISCLSKNRYYEVIKLVYPAITHILDSMCGEEKERMATIASEELGSWKKAVVTSDGVWHTRGYFSKNGSFIIKNYLTGGLLWYGHKCMRGGDNVIEDDLYAGTAKSMEGVLAHECYKQAKEEGCIINTVWQDGDSSSAKSVTSNHPTAKVYKCGGHVGRAFTNCLKEVAKKKEFSLDVQTKFKEKFPLIESAKCKCTRHKSGCGCMSDAFIKGARINHFCVLQQCKEPDGYAKRLRYLSQYHCRDIHQWEGGSCEFHDDLICSCGTCDEDEDVECDGKPYKTRFPLTCEFHWLAYRVECEKRAVEASSVIHPVLGRGHSNLCEAHFTVLPKFRAKDQSLNRLHYMCSTNAGLCQGNMTWCFHVRGPQYHWITELYTHLNLPVLPAVVQALEKTVEERANVLQKEKSDKVKKGRVRMKVARAEDQEARKKWLKRQTIQHTYGHDDVDDGDIAEEGPTDGDDTTVTVVSGKSCRCGSKEHLRTSHRSCPYNKSKNQ